MIERWRFWRPALRSGDFKCSELFQPRPGEIRPGGSVNDFSAGVADAERQFHLIRHCDGVVKAGTDFYRGFTFRQQRRFEMNAFQRNRRNVNEMYVPIQPAITGEITE